MERGLKVGQVQQRWGYIEKGWYSVKARGKEYVAKGGNVE